MRAALLYEANKPLEIKEVRQDPPKAGEVRVKTGVAGICASDHHVMTGNAVLPLPVVLGHEGAGTVIEVGEGVTRVKPGTGASSRLCPTAATAGPAEPVTPSSATQTWRPG